MTTLLPLYSFVKVNGASGRIGKVTQYSGNQVEVEFYHSLSDRPRQWFPDTAVKKTSISRQTRCYYWDEETGRWVMGRIMQQDGNEYEVDFPDRFSRYVDESKLFVRSDRPIDDPMEVLEVRGQETAFFAEHRSKFMDTLLRQRQASQGMHGLVSSKIRLYKHQVEVVRRVLEDPVPRYLLADEVGLGKTIEAGVIVRQYLLDHPEAQALMLIPPYLLEQWQREMSDKFYFAQFDGRVTWISTDEIDRLSKLSEMKWGMVVIDEAHELAAKAYSEESVERARYALLQRVSCSTKGMLLLSATPVLNNEHGFLAMLHLLDPDAYRLDDLEHFRDRVEKRQEIGNLLLNFKEDAKSFVLKRTLTQLTQYFPEDSLLQPMIQRLRETVDQPEATEERNMWIRNIRIHLSDTYRLHRRMLRNRRDSVVADLVFSRTEAQEQKGVCLEEEYDLDDRTERLQALLDEWRILSWESDPHGERKDLFQLLVESSGSSPNLLLSVLRARLQGKATKQLQEDLTARELRVLVETERFTGEEKCLNRIVDLFTEPAEMGDRLDHVAQLLEQFQMRAKKANVPLPKFVIFTSYPSVCREILEWLQDSIGQGAVAGFYQGMAKAAVEEQVESFHSDPNCFALVCDRTGEEGRNLQFADFLVHFDLPLSPTRVEQRTGRLDRLGRSTPFVTYVFMGPEETEGSLHHAWIEYLTKGLRLFEKSIATLQFFIEDQMPVLIDRFYAEGVAGIRNEIELSQPRLEEELQRIYEQQTLDELDLREQQTELLFADLQAYEDDPAQIQAGFEGWVIEALKLQQYWIDSSRKTFYYNPLHALIPYQYAMMLSTEKDRPHTYDRQVAVQSPRCTLYRIGEPFLDFLAWYLRWDDRGQVYAFWRHEPTLPRESGLEQFYFRLHYVAEGDIAPALAVMKQYGRTELDQPALQRKLDRYFPAHYQTVLVDAYGQAVEESDTREVLGKPFCKPEHGGRDTNLTKDRLVVLDRYFTDESWKESCREARLLSERQLRDEEDFVNQCRENAEIALRDWEHRNMQMALRAKREQAVDQERAASVNADLEFEKALHEALVQGIRRPKIRLDSVGLIVLSGLPKPSSRGV